MAFWSREDEPTASVKEAVEIFKGLAKPLVAKGDIDGVNRLYKSAYAEAMKGHRRHSLNGMQVTQRMEQALQDVLSHVARNRPHYFKEYRSSWWKENRKE